VNVNVCIENIGLPHHKRQSEQISGIRKSKCLFYAHKTQTPF